MRRHELSDEEWALIEGELPPIRGNGRPWRDHRQTLNGIFWILRTGAPWRDLSERYGLWQTVYERLNRWRRDGIFDRMLQRLQIRLDKQGHIDWDVWCVDGSSVRAHRAAAGAGKKGVLPKSRQTTRWVAQEAAGEPRFTWSVTARELR